MEGGKKQHMLTANHVRGSKTAKLNLISSIVELLPCEENE
jgi:hypothetical protein